MFVRRRPPHDPAPTALAEPPEHKLSPVVEARFEAPGEPGLDELKHEVHARLLDEADASIFARDTWPAESGELLRRLILEASQRRDMLLSRQRLEQLQYELMNEIRGLGPLEPLLADPTISEIMVNSAQQVYVEQQGRLVLTPVRFKDDKHLLRIIDRIVSKVGRHIDEATPMCDARLPDGSRVNAIIPPLALNGPSLTIRRFGRVPLTIDALVASGSLTGGMATFLNHAVKAKLNIIVSGGTGTGKTTILNVLSGFIPASERLITIEDAAELQMQQPHVVRLETRQPNIEGQGAITQEELLRNTLRMRPDRIIIGEVRGGEALSMLQAMNTGHEGSLTSVHANTCRDALSRLETMVLMSGVDLPHRAIREQIVSALDLIVQVERAEDGRRRITQVSEVLGLEGDVYQLQDLFRYQHEAGAHAPTGIIPRCLTRMRDKGLALPLPIFHEGSVA